MIVFKLFYEFFLIGLFAVGGGMATIPFLQSLSERTGWFSLAELADMIAVSESTPGPIGVNIATYAGFQTFGIAGVISAVVGLTLPSVIIILVISRFLKSFRENRDVDAGLKTMRPAACAMIASVGIGMFRSEVFITPFDWRIIVFFTVLLAAMLKTKLHPLIFIALSAVFGIIFKL